MNYRDLCLKIFYPKFIHQNEVNDFNKVYDLWFKIWIETRKEVDSQVTPVSDNFSRQDEILCLFFQNEPVAIVCHRYFNSEFECFHNDSFFIQSLWSEETRKKAFALGRWIVFGSHIFIEKKYRKSNFDFPLKELICNLSFSHLNGNSPDAVIGMMRKDKGMHNLLYKGGGICLAEDVYFYQIPVDLVAFVTKNRPIYIDERYNEAISYIRQNCHKFENNFIMNSLTKSYQEVWQENQIKPNLKRAG